MDSNDTAKGISDLVPMQDLFNEWHAKNTSQKVRNVFKSKGMSGAPLTTNPPFGYLKDLESKNGWIVDEDAAKTVRQIFAWCIDGLGPTQIAKRLKAAKGRRLRSIGAISAGIAASRLPCPTTGVLPPWRTFSASRNTAAIR